jgi:hypothetical protein
MLRGKWWEIYNDPQLNELEEKLNINNQTIKQYFENYMAARSIIAQARAQLYPTLSVAPGFQRTRSSANLRNANTTGTTTGTGSTGSGGTGGTGGTGTTTTTGTSTNSGQQSTVWSLPAEASWEPDLWGKIRNTIRENQYAAQVSAADLENERLSEQASLAVYLFELRGEDALAEVYKGTVEADQKSLDLTQNLYNPAKRAGRFNQCRRGARTIRARDRSSHRRQPLYLFHSAQATRLDPAACSARHAVTTARKAPRCCRRGADHGRGQRADRRRDRSLFSLPRPHRVGRIGELGNFDLD